MGRAGVSTAVSLGGQSGCFPALLPPLAVLLVGALLAGLVFRLPVPQGNGLGRLSPIFTPQVQRWAASILRWAETWDMDPNLIATLMQIESCGHPRARSRAGALGLFQVMPYHFSALEDPFDPETNAARGLGYLQRALRAARGDVRLALAGYNGGLGVISRPASLWPAETVRYVDLGEGIYADARRGRDSSAALTEWYTKYGAGLCRAAEGGYP